jgi:phosphoribosylamine--glycine ligase
MLSGASFGDAGTTVVLEERLIGSEASIHAICDGERAIVLPTAQDHKRIFDGDLGPNTGGMGAYAPAPVVNDAMLAQIKTDVIERVVAGMKEEGTPFIGALFGGLMITDEGEPIVLEFNVRFGDPETQVLTQIVEGDFGEALLAAAQGRLQEGMLKSSGEHAMCVVLAAENYPASPTKGDPIVGVSTAEEGEGVRVFHAGTALSEGQLVTAGGRVLGVTARGSSLRQARDRVYAAVDQIQFRGQQVRRDIGHRAL